MTKKILVVDDSSLMRRILSNELKPSGFEVFEAADGASALEAAEKIKPDLITMDVDMPVMDGYEAVRRIRTELKLLSEEDDREIPIIFVTSNDSVEHRKQGFQVGATDFIVKPFLKGEVKATVHNLLYPEKRLEGATALVADDSALTRNIIVNVLKSEGIGSIVASNGLEALEILRKQEDTIDLVLTDLVMPEMDGIELCSRIRLELGNRSLPILFLSSMSETKSILEMFKAGASDYVVKPFVKEELMARVRVHLTTKQLTQKLFTQVHEHKRLNKLKDDILSVTSHDLRSPLNGIMGFTDLLMHEEDLNDTHREYLKHIQNSGEFLLTLINDILDLGQTQSEGHELEMSVVSVNELIESSVSTVRHMATPKGIDIQVENRCDAKPYILGDQNALIRIFNNLLSNAIKFTRKDGVVKQVIELENEGLLKISVEDNGIGIPKDMIDQLFIKFSKASRPGTSGEKSTGLGLSITRELVERHSGTITVESEEGQGTCFTIHLPFTDAPGKQDNKQEQPTETDRFAANIMVLVVDDNATNIKLAEKVLKKQKFLVKSAQDGKQAVDAYIKSLGKGERQYDMIFMDIRMPIMDGFEATKQIRKHEQQHELPETPIIAMTAGTNQLWRERCTEMGLSGTVTKPIELKQIKAIIEEFLHIEKN